MKEQRGVALIGRWLFIGAEIYQDSAWVESEDFVRGLRWTFLPQFFKGSKSIGTIVESSPNNTPIELNYSYNSGEGFLNISSSDDQLKSSFDSEECDSYMVQSSSRGVANNPVIKLSILNSEGSPPPYLRYILQRVE